METLTKTAIFCLLSGERTVAQQAATLESVYKDFVHSVVNLCMTSAEIPAFFSLNYARLEFAQLLSDKMVAGLGKK